MAFLGSERSHKIENHELATSAQRHADRRILRGRAGRDSIGPPRQEAGDVNALTGRALELQAYRSGSPAPESAEGRVANFSRLERKTRWE